jgi:cytosolic carboxypeptidase protein 2/3
VEEIIKEVVEQQSDYSKWITDNFVLRIFPMVNVDGVIYGNFRCDLAGYDLNRTWKNPLQSVHPQIFGIKAELEKLSDKNGILLCLDLHTHSKELGAFAYCCVESEKGR